MSEVGEQRKYRVLTGLVRESIPGSIFTSGIILTYGYVTGLVFSVGDPRQLTPILAGLIAGIIVFSLAGYGMRPSRVILFSATILSGVLLIVAYGIISINSLVINDSELLVISFLISSPAMAISQLLRETQLHRSIPARLILGFVHAFLAIIFVFSFALEYEIHGQLNLYVGPLFFLLVSLAYLATTKLL